VGGTLAAARGVRAATRRHFEQPTGIQVWPESRLGLAGVTTFEFAATGGSEDPEATLVWYIGDGGVRYGRHVSWQFGEAGVFRISVGLRDERDGRPQRKEGGPVMTVETRSLSGTWVGTLPTTGAALSATVVHFQHVLRFTFQGLLGAGATCGQEGQIRGPWGAQIGDPPPEPLEFALDRGGDCGEIHGWVDTDFEGLDIEWTPLPARAGPRKLRFRLTR